MTSSLSPQQLAEIVRECFDYCERNADAQTFDARRRFEAALDALEARAEAAERDAVAVREKMLHNAANLEVAIERREAAEQALRLIANPPHFYITAADIARKALAGSPGEQQTP